MNCPKCGSTRTGKNGKRPDGVQKYICYECKANYTDNSRSMVPEVSQLPEVPLDIPGVPQMKGLSEEELRSKHDNYFICSQMVAKLSRGNFLPERDFVVFCNFKQGTGYRLAMEDHRFDDNHGQAGGVTYWGHKEDIQRLKSEGVLR